MSCINGLLSLALKENYLTEVCADVLEDGEGKSTVTAAGRRPAPRSTSAGPDEEFAGLRAT